MFSRAFYSTFFCLFIALNCFAQDNTRLSAAFDPPGRKRFYFNAGDYIKVKINSQDGMQTLMITEVRDSGVVFNSRYFTYYNQIDRITLFPRKRNRGLKKVLAFGGLVMPGISGANALLNKNMPRTYLAPIALGGVPFAAAYFGLKMNDWVGVRYNCKRNRIKPTIYQPSINTTPLPNYIPKDKYK